ncbi:type II secretion system protein [Patescibacteria group bacterium]
MHKNQKGFTLIELMLVSLIIGVMAVNAFAALNKAREKARDVQRVANLRNISLALELYYNDNNGYPSDAIADNNDWEILFNELKISRIINAIPLEDLEQGQISYYYHTLSTTTNMANDYILGVVLENEEHPNLKGDFDGNLYGIDCADPIYCFKP